MTCKDNFKNKHLEIRKILLGNQANEPFTFPPAEICSGMQKKKNYKGAHDSAPSDSGKPLVETDEESGMARMRPTVCL